jgi:hypothetical protein
MYILGSRTKMLRGFRRIVDTTSNKVNNNYEKDYMNYGVQKCLGSQLNHTKIEEKYGMSGCKSGFNLYINLSLNFLGFTLLKSRVVLY